MFRIKDYKEKGETVYYVEERIFFIWWKISHPVKDLEKAEMIKKLFKL